MGFRVLGFGVKVHQPEDSTWKVLNVSSSGFGLRLRGFGMALRLIVIAMLQQGIPQNSGTLL